MSPRLSRGRGKFFRGGRTPPHPALRATFPPRGRLGRRGQAPALHGAFFVAREKVNWPKGPREAGLGRDLGARKSVGASGRPRPTWSAPFVGADVPIGPYEDGALSVIARRAAGPTRQSVSLSKEKRIPTAPLGPRNDGRRGQAPPYTVRFSWRARR